MKGGAKVVIEPHRHEGVFVAKAKEDALVTKNLVPGESVYGEKRISVEVRFVLQISNFSPEERRFWLPGIVGVNVEVF